MKKLFTLSAVVLLCSAAGFGAIVTNFFADFEGSPAGNLSTTLSASESQLDAGTSTGSWTITDVQESYIGTNAVQHRLCMDFGQYNMSADLASSATLSDGVTFSIYANNRRGGTVKTSVIRFKNESNANLLSLRFVPDGTAPTLQLFDIVNGWTDLGAIQFNSVGTPNWDGMDFVEVQMSGSSFNVLLNGTNVAANVNYANSGTTLDALSFIGEHDQSGIWYDNVLVTTIPEPATIGLVGFASLGLLMLRKLR